MDNFNRIAMRNWEKRCAHTQQSFPHELNYPNASNFICKKKLNETYEKLVSDWSLGYNIQFIYFLTGMFYNQLLNQFA